MKNYIANISQRYLLPALVAGALAAAVSQANATVNLGNPYAPAGANYTITAKSGINSVNGSGGTSVGAQVNSDFEFKGALGVTYTAGGKTTPWGIGIYSSGGTVSTGLDITLNQQSIASSVSITLADFDINTGDPFFKTGKVESSILVYGSNNTVLFSANPTDVFKAMTPSANGKSDYWDLNFGQLLSNAGQSSNTPISGFLLYADSANGEKVGSDPYFLVAVNGGIPMVPEPSTYLGGFAAIAFLIGMHARVVLKKKKTSLV
jgi:hypothetical protein